MCQSFEHSRTQYSRIALFVDFFMKIPKNWVISAGTRWQWPFLAFFWSRKSVYLAAVRCLCMYFIFKSFFVLKVAWFWQLRFFQNKIFSCEKLSEMAASHSCFTKLEFLHKIIEKRNGGSLLERFSKGNGAPKAPFRLMAEEVLFRSIFEISGIMKRVWVWFLKILVCQR